MGKTPVVPLNEFYRYSEHANAIETARRRWEGKKYRIRPLVFERDAFTCQECGFVGEPQRFKAGEFGFQALDGIGLVVDHIVAISAGGGDEMSNLATLCWTCNSRKAAAEGRERRATKKALGYVR